MDKYEYQLKLDQINKLADRGDYATAMKIANNIDWRRVRSVNTLSRIAEVYEKNGEYEESRDLLVMAYERAPVGRMIAYRLSNLCVELKDFDQAIEYYKDFVHSAPKDPAKLLLKYKIFRGKGAALKDQIAILEEYRTQEYEEEWALELAYLYQEAGDIARCVNECDELILWFNDGQYVLKAMELKMQYAELTPSQMEKYELRMNRTKLVDAREGTRKSKKASARGSQSAQQNYDPTYVQGYQDAYDSNYMQGYQQGYDPNYMQGYQQDYEPGYQEPYYGGYDPKASEYQPEEPLPQIEDPDILMQGEALTIEEDGQMKLEMPQYQPVEKQITGQMTIQEILAEWEKVKQEEEGVLSEAEPMETMKDTSEQRPEEETVSEEPEKEQEVLGAPAITIVEEELPEEEEEDIPEEEPEFMMDMELPEIAMPEGFDDAEEDAAEPEVTEEAPVQEAEEVITEPIQEAEEVITEPIQEAEEVIAEPIQEAEAPMQEEEPEDVPVIAIVEEELPEEEEEIPVEEPEFMMDMELPEIAMPEGFGDEGEEDVEEEDALPEEDIEEEDSIEEEDDDAADDLEAKIIRSLSRDSLALADAEDGNLDGRFGDEDVRKYELKRSTRRTEKRVIEKHGTLTEEQQRIFSYFTPVHGMSDQLWEALEKEKECVREGSSMTGNIMIMGDAGTGKTMLAVNLVKAIQKTRNERSGRLAKISAETLNEKDITAVVKKLNGGALIIERASELTNESAIRLEMAMKGRTGELLFIFEDEKQALKRFMKLHPKLAQTFTTKIDIPVFSNDELVEFGKCYAHELEYSIDEMAVLALYNRIGNMQRDDYDVSVTDVKKIIDAAIEKSERGGIGKFFGSLSKKRYDDDDCIILREKDFEE